MIKECVVLWLICMLDSTEVTSAAFSPATDQLQALGVYVTIHGHFYQPPRENPYLNAIEHQPSAQPFHDWNERIYYECYRPNAFARILNDRGEVIDIVNNFEYLSFNIGPTLFSWLERYDLEVYQRIIEADRHSCQRFNGHGNAIAQVYNHMILPWPTIAINSHKFVGAKPTFGGGLAENQRGCGLRKPRLMMKL